MNNLVKYLLEDVNKYIKEHPEDNDHLDVRIYRKNDNTPLSFCVNCYFSMRDDEILLIEYGNDPERTVIPVDEISYYELVDTSENETSEDEVPEEDSFDKSENDNSYSSSGDGSSTMKGPDIITQGIIDSASGGGIFSSIFGI